MRVRESERERESERARESVARSVEVSAMLGSENKQQGQQR
jgi:hypothetical protein